VSCEHRIGLQRGKKRCVVNDKRSEGYDARHIPTLARPAPAPSTLERLR
jgi:hypothetical protein